MIKTAIMVDGAFYRKRAYYFWGDKSPADRAKELNDYCRSHIKESNDDSFLYRVLYYDCPPISKRIHHPFTNKSVDLSETEIYKWTNEFFIELTKLRKFAVRKGRLAEEQARYVLNPKTTTKLIRKDITIDDLSEKDFSFNIDQKGVDMKIGLDIASLSYKRLVDRIILISGDSDFVPAAKLARREGIDFILDPMRATIKTDLQEHIDGLRTKAPNTK